MPRTEPHVALATSRSNLPPGDVALGKALERRGARATPAIWSSPDIDWAAFDLVVIRSCWDYHLRLDEFLAWIAGVAAAGVGVMNAPDLVLWNATKTYLREVAGRGITVPDTEWLGPGDEVDLGVLCSARDWLTAVVKPIVSASAYRTERRREGLVRGPAMVQAYQEAIEREGEWSVVFLGGRHSHDVRKRAQPLDFRVQMEFGGSVEVAMAPAQVIAFAEAALACLPVPAHLARVDVIHEGALTTLMEIEVIEPELFLDVVPRAAHRAAAVILGECMRRSASLRSRG